jgi:hypothetical protein
MLKKVSHHGPKGAIGGPQGQDFQWNSDVIAGTRAG